MKNAFLSKRNICLLKQAIVNGSVGLLSSNDDK